MVNYRSLSPGDKKALLKFPAYISILAANSDATLDDEEKASAIQLMHTKTYSCHPLLAPFYKEAGENFKATIEQLDATLPKDRESRDIAIRNELAGIEIIVLKFSKGYARVMRRSIHSFVEHVSKAHHNALFDFIFPIPITGITE